MKTDGNQIQDVLCTVHNSGNKENYVQPANTNFK